MSVAAAPFSAFARSSPIALYSASRRHLISRPLSTYIHHLSPPHRPPPLLHHSLLPPRRPLPLPLIWPPTRTLPTSALPRHLTCPCHPKQQQQQQLQELQKP